MDTTNAHDEADPALLQILVCPVTKQPLTYDREAQELISKAVRSSSAVLITGESGVGKDIAAIEIHRLSGRTGRYLPKKAASHLARV